jgi:single stranded DNA-binding protein
VNGIQAALSGRLTADPEQRYTKSGTLILQLALVVDEQRRGLDTPPTYVRATLWEAMAEAMAPGLARDSQVYLEGRLTLPRWRGQEGTERSGLSLSATRCDVFGAVGRRPSTGPALAQHQAGMVLGGTSVGRPGNAEPIDFDAPRDPLPLRQRIAAAAAEGTQRAAARRPWRR